MPLFVTKVETVWDPTLCILTVAHRGCRCYLRSSWTTASPPPKGRALLMQTSASDKAIPCCKWQLWKDEQRHHVTTRRRALSLSLSLSLSLFASVSLASPTVFAT
ncbi:hypothetical protein JG688_00002209 [Phytophthora aleatoria]|uniref:Uncharacterized protein n=1 Tax=Phytophthora aleatoria TaxID=2496075 RepID=A0A8J5IUX7_9STRA|nr:hypothetical protein JG688_00002209 [Phytophthora aleatoria]